MPKHASTASDSPTGQDPLADWSEAVTDIPDSGRERRRSASAADRASLAKSLDLIAIESLIAKYRVKPLPRHRFLIEGTVDAEVTQACVITLEPLPVTINEAFTLELWPEDAMPDAPKGEMAIADVLDIESYSHGLLPLGQIIYETFAAGLDPNPRKDGATFDWRDPKDQGDGGKPNPFAALKDLKLDRGKP